MDKQKKPGISIARVTLLSCQVSEVKTGGAAAEPHLVLLSLKRVTSDDDVHMTFRASFSIFGDAATAPCTFVCDFEAEYARPAAAAMTWDEFTDAIALAHIVPYLREFVSNITARMPFHAVYLPPTNTWWLIDQMKRAQTKREPHANPP